MTLLLTTTIINNNQSINNQQPTTNNQQQPTTINNQQQPTPTNTNQHQPTPKGPYTYVGDINPLFAVHPYVPTPGKPPSVWHEYTMPCQQSGFAVLPNMVDEHGHNVIMWQGDGWQQASDGRKDHDPQVTAVTS